MSNAELVATIAHILEPWAFETISYNATVARDDATAKAMEIVEALAALDSRAGDAGEGESANRVIYLLQGDNSRMAEALRSCREQFAFYASEHTAAGKSEKAATNARFAKIVDDALTAIKPATPAPAVDAVPAGEVEAFRRGAEAMQRKLADALRDHLNSRAAAIANGVTIPEYQA